ncbi:unnamed protein product, partial [Brassica rapa subsp. trilocularis]
MLLKTVSSSSAAREFPWRNQGRFSSAILREPSWKIHHRSQAASFSSCLRRLRRSSISSLEAPTSRSLFKSTLTSR